MRIIIINSGSSSIKYESFDLNGFVSVSKGLLERIGAPDSSLRHQYVSADGVWKEIVEKTSIADHREGFSYILEVTGRTRVDQGPFEIFGVGHRVVHGGETFRESAIIDDAALAAIEKLIPLAPLHNPANLIGITVMRELLPDVPQVAVFDTAFHQTMPPEAFHYALPYEFYESYGVRRYGFHGSSHQYVAGEAARYLGKPLEDLNLITFHLGNGASVTAIERGKSIDTSMGLTPLEGLIMGTRCGDVDPAVHFYLAKRTKKSVEEIEDILNRESGLKGICGLNDMREIQNRAGKGDIRAQLAIDMLCYRIKKYIGAYSAALGSVDGIVFTGGMGENSAIIREKSCEGLSAFGITIDPSKNNNPGNGIAEIQDASGRVNILVIPTDEEYEIARQTLEVIKKMKGQDVLMDPKNYSVQDTVKGGLQVTIRAIRPDDRDAFREAVDELDDRSIYLRFFSPKKVSDKELADATDVDFVRTIALVACLQENGAEKIIGGCRYIVFGKSGPPDKAEVAFTVRKGYQGFGIASVMLRHLAGIAKEKGITEFHADVLSDNTGMLTVFKRSGFAMKQTYEYGVAHVTLSLSGDRS